MKKVKYYFLLFLLISVAILPIEVKAEEQLETQESIVLEEETNLIYNGYQISSYHVDIIVKENNILEIKENIGAYFELPKHGIFRTIPLFNTITREDGTESQNRVVIEDITVDNKFTTYNENGKKVIKIGDPEETLVGYHDYEITYTYNLGNDPSSDYDELYFNIIGTEWDTTISNVTFTITMPKEFDESKLGFTSGRYGSSETDNIIYEVANNKITGILTDVLDINEGFTVRLELEEGYFINTGLPDEILSIIAMTLAVIFALISFLMWKKHGDDDEVVEVVEFYPPDNYNSVEIAQLYNGYATKKDAVSLLIHLANDGYIKITETEEKSKKKVEITKLKEYAGTNKNEMLFFNGLFKKSKGKDKVTLDSLKNTFYTVINKVIINVNSDKNTNKIFIKTNWKRVMTIVVMIFILASLITIPPLSLYYDTETLVITIIFPIVGFAIIAASFWATDKDILQGGIIFGLLFGGLPWFFFVFPILQLDIMYLTTYIIGAISIIIMIVCLKYMAKRNEYGMKMLGRIEGFKSFLETVEKDKLEELVSENPTYFYDILPYTYVLGISKKWMSKFEVMAIEPPSWYDGVDTTFNLVRFSSFMNDTMTSAQKTMTSLPQSSGSGGGFSGGGFSGGGSGGGGGGSW